MTYARVVQTATLLLVMAGLTGCFSSQPRDIQAFLRPGEVEVTAKRYVLRPPDEVEIHCSRVPEIHMQRQIIRPDGKICFEAVGEVDVAGKTPTEVADLLRAKAAQLYALPGTNPIEVRVVVFRSAVYYVLGQVNLPGPKAYTGYDTALTAITAAQLNPMAWKERIQVIRPSQSKKIRPRIFEMNLERMIVHGDISKNVLLQEGDIVYVPPTVLAAISMKIEEVLRPIARAFSGYYITQGAYGGGYGGVSGGGYGGGL